jgi:hypothetical protein
MRRYRSTYKPRSLRKLEKKTRSRVVIAVIMVVLLGVFLINWGLPALIGALGSINNLKPKPTVSKATTDEAVAPPVLNIPFEATNSAMLSLKGYTTADAKVEIYVDEEIKSTAQAEGNGSFSTSVALSVGNNNIYGITVDGDKKSLPSKTIRLLYSDEKPDLKLNEPPDNHEIKGGDKKVRVSGKTETQNSVTVNGSTVILNGDGGFLTELNINEGENVIKVMATNQFNNSTEIERKVKYSP